MGKKLMRQNKMNELAKLFGANTGEKVAIRCRGKWAGTTDYSVAFDNKERYFISNGMATFDESLDRYISTYTTFLEEKSQLLEILKKREEIDNNIAKERGLATYKVIDIDYIKNGFNYIGWFYAVLEINGKKHNFMETSLYYAIKNGPTTLQDYVNENTQYKYMAGGLEHEDFIFHGVGHSLAEKRFTTPEAV